MKVFLCSLLLAETTFMSADGRRKLPDSNLPKERVVRIRSLTGLFISLLSSLKSTLLVRGFSEVDGCVKNLFLTR